MKDLIEVPRRHVLRGDSQRLLHRADRAEQRVVQVPNLAFGVGDQQTTTDRVIGTEMGVPEARPVGWSQPPVGILVFTVARLGEAFA